MLEIFIIPVAHQGNPHHPSQKSPPGDRPPSENFLDKGDSSKALKLSGSLETSLGLKCAVQGIEVLQ
jgi:hypothetical protein